MKKFFIGLLVLAAGASLYFLLQEDQLFTRKNIHKESLIGKWKLDSIQLPEDSNDAFLVSRMGLADPYVKNRRYEFTRGGAISISLEDSATSDSAWYSWTKKGRLNWKTFSADTTGNLFNVSLLNSDSLILLAQDSVSLQFTKVK